MGRFNIKIIDDFDDLDRYQAAWDDLLDQAEFVSIFQSYEWHDLWWQSFGDGYQAFVLLALDEDRLIGLAPLCITSKRINGLREKVLTFIGADNLSSDYVDFIIEKDNTDVLDSFLLTIRQSNDLWTVLSWPNMPGFSINRLRTEQYFKQRKHAAITGFLYDAPVWKLENNSHDTDVLSKKSVLRKVKALEREGDLAFRHCQDIDETKTLLELLVAQHIERWSGTKYPSLFCDPQQVKFFNALVEGLLPIKLLSFSVLSLNSKPIALHLGFEYKGSYLWYKPSYDQAYAEFSPGLVLLHNLFKYVSDNNLKEFDFGCGSEFFKYRFSNHIRKIYRLDIYRRSFSSLLANFRNVLRGLKKRKKRSK